MIPIIIIAFIAGMASFPVVLFIAIMIFDKPKSQNEDEDTPFNKDGTPKRIIFKSDDI